MKFFVSMGLFLFLVSCSTLSTSNNVCEVEDWEARGKEDALAGERAPRVEDYISNCSRKQETKAENKIDKEEYNAGFAQGLNEYCTYSRGLELGVAGKKPHQLCERINDDFESGYLEGIEQFEQNP